MRDTVMIHWYLDGAEHDEEWPSHDAFLAWCAGKGLRPGWRASREGEDGEWLMFAQSGS